MCKMKVGFSFFLQNQTFFLRGGGLKSVFLFFPSKPKVDISVSTEKKRTDRTDGYFFSRKSKQKFYLRAGLFFVLIR